MKFNVLLTLILLLHIGQSNAQSTIIECKNGVTLNCRITSKKSREVTILSLENMNGNNLLSIPEIVDIEGSEYYIKSVYNQAFGSVDNIDSLIISSGNIILKDRAFEKSSICYANLKGVKSIGEYAFLGCDNIKEVLLGDNIKSIGKKAFEKCKGFQLHLGVNSAIDYYSSIDREYSYNRKNGIVTVDSVRCVDKFKRQSDDLYTYIVIDSIPSKNREQIYNLAKSYLANNYNIAPSNNAAESIVAQGEVKKIWSETSYAFGRIKDFDLFYSIQADCKDERIRLKVSLRKFSVLDRSMSGKGIPTRSDKPIYMFLDERVYRVSCMKLLHIAEKFITSLLENEGTISGDDW